MTTLLCKNRFTFFAILVATALSFCFASATARAEHKGPDSELARKMKLMGKNLKELKPQIADATKQQASVDLLETVKKIATEAKNLTPTKAKNTPEADRTKFISEFQSQIDKLIEALGKIEDAVKAGKYDDAKTLFGDLQMIKRSGHEKFAPKDG